MKYIFLILLLLPFSFAFGDEISYVGVNVRNSTGQLLNGQHSVTTELYTAGTGGTLLLTNTTTVNITAGNFVVVIGNYIPDKNQTFWVQTRILNYNYTRFLYTAAAQAIQARNASNAVGGSGSSDFASLTGLPDMCPSTYSLSGYFINGSGAYANCTATLFAIQAGSNVVIVQNVNGSINISSTGDSSGSGNITGSYTAGYLPVATNGSNLVSSTLFQLNNRFGINTTQPNATLQVNTRNSVFAEINNQTNYHLLLKNDADTNGAGIGLGFVASSASGGNNIGGAVIYTREGSNSQGNLSFYVKSGTSAGTGLIPGIQVLSNGSVNFPYGIMINGVHLSSGSGSNAFADLTGIPGMCPANYALSGYFTNASGAFANCSAVLAGVQAGSNVAVVMNANGSINVSSSGSSGGAGNITGSGYVSGTNQTIALWSNGTNLNFNSGLFVEPNGNLWLPRVLRLADYGSDSSIRFNDSTAGPGVAWLRGSNRLRIDCAGATGTCDVLGSGWFAPGNAGLFTWSVYSDTVNNTVRLANTGAQQAWLWVDNKVAVGVQPTAASAALTVATGNVNITQTGSCIWLPGGGRLCGNSTSTYLVSPNGATVVEASN
jgi:hypothetical protein